MIDSFIRLIKITVCSGFFLLWAVYLCFYFQSGKPMGVAFAGKSFLALLSTSLLYLALNALFRSINTGFRKMGTDQIGYLDSIPSRYLNWAIIGSSAVSLFLELAMIRWQGEVFPIFAFYKNYSLLSCFAGLGLGYALARQNFLPLTITLPCLSLQMIFLMILRYGFSTETSKVLFQIPFREQLNMGAEIARNTLSLSVIYLFLTVVFLMTALAFIPVGQVCGRLVNRRDNLKSYGLNLLGSLLGIVGISILSFLWTPPVVWFGVCIAVLLSFQLFTIRALWIGILAGISMIIILDWPVQPGIESIHSPYQLISRGPGTKGWMCIQAAGLFYQQVVDLSGSATNPDIDADLRLAADYYEIPYSIYRKPLTEIAVVGAGTGNDVAAALRSGAQKIDAIEIDPAIQSLGKMYHPENPYGDDRVHPIVNDARTFLRTTDKQYDMIVYGLLDSHTLLSHASNIRLDSFVYTIEGFREARARLKENGLLSLSFCVLTHELGQKIFLMMKEAFDGSPPVCILTARTGIQTLVTFLQNKEGTLTLQKDWFTGTTFEDGTPLFTDPSLKADVCTDDWPFFYMLRRIYPVTYLGLIALLMGLSILLTANFIQEKPTFSNLTFFFLGAGFMLVETKAITEMGLTFGNTWLVIAIVTSSILSMAYLANLAVQIFGISRPLIPFGLLIVSLLVGYTISRSGGFDASVTGKLSTIIMLTCPMFFSGIVFSSLIRNLSQMSGILAINLLGSMLGGLLEYNSMYFGFSSLYLLATALYIAAAVTYFFRSSPQITP